jgi:hypothetical protein
MAVKEARLGHLSLDMLEHYATLWIKQFRDHLPTAGGAEGDPPDTVKLRPGKTVIIKSLDGKWIKLAAADEVLSAYARTMLKAAFTELNGDRKEELR